MRKSLNRPVETPCQVVTVPMGQAMIEFMIMLAVALSLVVLMGSTFRQATIAVWGYYVRQVSAPCPGCPPDSRYRFR